MSRKSNLQMIWTLAVLRHGAQGDVGSLADAEFRFARRKGELEGSPVRTLPGGLVSLLSDGEFVDDAMESGFMVEMSRLARRGRGWSPFTMLVGDVSWNRHRPNCSPRSVYAEAESSETVEFADTSPCSFYNQLPARIRIRVTPLPIPIIAWAFSNGVYKCVQGDQRTLDDWVDLSELSPPEKAEELVLPGPPIKEYQFL